MHAALGTILRRIHLEIRNATTLRIIKLNSIARRFSRGDYFPRARRGGGFLLSHTPLPPPRPSAFSRATTPPFAVNNPWPTEASSQHGIVEEALPTEENFLESRREIKSPTATRVDDSASLMRE